MIDIIAFSRNCNLRKCLQLSVKRCDDWFEHDRGASQFLRCKGWIVLIVVVHDVNVSHESRSRFEYGRFGASEFKFQLGADDARFDIGLSIGRFTHEIIGQ